MKPIDVRTYISKHVESGKRKLYEYGLRQLLSFWGKFLTGAKRTMSLSVKPNEKQLDPDSKPRLLCCPNKSMFPCGVVSYNMLTVLK